ncbi:hypothetical protein Dimus_015502 [Dionaea muscipula]
MAKRGRPKKGGTMQRGGSTSEVVIEGSAGLRPVDLGGSQKPSVEFPDSSRRAGCAEHWDDDEGSLIENEVIVGKMSESPFLEALQRDLVVPEGGMPSDLEGRQEWRPKQGMGVRAAPNVKPPGDTSLVTQKVVGQRGDQVGKQKIGTGYLDPCRKGLSDSEGAELSSCGLRAWRGL